jgi:transposase
MTVMELYAALDVSLHKTSVCVLDRDGQTVLEAVVASDPEALAACLAPYRQRLVRLGLEAGPLSEWLVRGLAEHGLTAVLMETRQVRAALSAMVTKTDRGDARGMAHLLRLGWFRPVHVKTVEAREQRALLTARSVLVRRLRDLENSVRGLLRGFGLRLPRLLRGRWDAGVRETVAGHPVLPAVLEPLLLACSALRDQLAVLDKRVRVIARADEVCRRLMSVPGVGAIVALTFRAAVDRPERFSSSKGIGAHFGLTPKRYQSGETDRVGAISRAGDPSVRVALFEAAHVMLTRAARWSSLKAWAMRLAERRGAKRAKVALARKLGIVMHRMWVDGTSFRFGGAAEAAAPAT